MVTDSILPLLAWMASLLAVPAILVLRAKPNAREAATFIAAIFKFGFVLAMLPTVMGGEILRFSFGEILPGIPLEFRVDGLGMLFALVASSLWILTTLYAVGYMRGLKEHDQTRFFTCFAIAISQLIRYEESVLRSY